MAARETPPTTPPSTPPSGTPCPRSRPDVVFRRVAGDWLLFDPAAGRIHVLNLAAALVWSHCDGTTPVDAIRAAVRDAWQGEVSGDPVDDSLKRFRREGLLVAVEAAGEP